MSRPSKELFAKMRAQVDAMERILNDNSLTAEVQISDTNMGCWAMVQLAFLLQQAVYDELSDLE